MEENQQIRIDTDVYTIGRCRDPHWPKCYFASVGSKKHHVTFILHGQTGRIQALRTRGNEGQTWGLLAIAAGNM